MTTISRSTLLGAPQSALDGGATLLQSFSQTEKKASASFQTVAQRPWYLVTGCSMEWISVLDDLACYDPISRIFRSQVTDSDNFVSKKPSIFSANKILTGYNKSCRSYVRYQQASQKNDYWGMTYAKIGMARGVYSIAKQVTALPLGALCTKEVQTGFKVNKLAHAMLQNIGFVCDALDAVLTLFPELVTFTKRIKLSWNLYNCMKETDLDAKLRSTINYIFKEIELSEQERLAIADDLSDFSLGETGNQQPVEKEDLLSEEDKTHAKQLAHAICQKNRRCNRSTTRQVARAIRQKFLLEKKGKYAEFMRKLGCDSLQCAFDQISKPKEEQLLYRLLHSKDGSALCEAQKEAQLFVDEIRNRVHSKCARQLSIFTSSFAFFSLKWLGFANMVTLGTSAYKLSTLWSAKEKFNLSAQDKVALALFLIFTATSATLEGVFSATLIPFIVASSILLLGIGSMLYQCDANSYLALRAGATDRQAILSNQDACRPNRSKPNRPNRSFGHKQRSCRSKSHSKRSHAKRFFMKKSASETGACTI